MRLAGTILVTCLIFLFSLGCSNTEPPTTPGPVDNHETAAVNQLWAAVDFSWDGVSEDLTVVPSRSTEIHLNLTPLLPPGAVQLTILGWDPGTQVLTIRATLTNPYPVSGYDVRGIVTNLIGGEVLNPDDYTKLFDPHVPPIPNAFRAYAKEETNRRFYGNDADPSQYIKSETYEIYFPSVLVGTFIVTASWPTNAEEPYDIVSIDQVGTLTDAGGSLEVTVEVLDWQDVTADDVIIEDNPVTGAHVFMTQIDTTLWQATLTNAGGAPPGEYEVWVAALDYDVSYPLYNKFTITVEPFNPTVWSDPILVSGDAGVDEILPRIVLRENDYWIVYTDGTDALARMSTDGGLNWSAPMTIGNYEDIDTIHAVPGGDSIFVQYQTSTSKETWLSEYSAGAWSAPVRNNMMGLTTQPWSCDFGVGGDGTLFDMWTGGWSMFGFHSENPLDLSAFIYDNIQPMYNAVYSINDGFVQDAQTPTLFYVHDDTQLDYGYFDGALWQKAAAYTSQDTFIEPAIAPESDIPFHCVVGFNRGANNDVQYLRFDTWPPASPTVTSLATGLIDEPTFHSISVEGDVVSVLYDADGEIRYVESTNGGDSFTSDLVLSPTSMYSHIRIDGYTDSTVAAYAMDEGGDYNIYVRIKN